MEEIASSVKDLELEKGDEYRSFLHGDTEKDTVWRLGEAPEYDLVNRTFRSGRTKDWKPGSLEETVQHLVKTWEMELTHKTRIKDFKSIDAENFSFSVNGNHSMTGEELLRTGSYNALLASLEHGGANNPPLYKSSQETFESSHEIFRGVFPNGFAWEVLEVFSGPPTVAFKWRHWGKMEGSFKEHNLNGKTAEMFGIAIAEVNDELKIGRLEVFYDPSQLLTQLTCPYNPKR
ncbi:hypothetical protein SELMODRAFT_125190 [Selaginella moellendorffii]|uniref:Pathogen-related protein n=1 Tax=Selaginella moellendorffii TaxID=88036 RepID=D8SUH8_SELML|nr:hypothetical protein SELMODRAFT_125190 [Selaginella moellendorffii]